MSVVGTTAPNVTPIIIASAHRTMLGAKPENRLRVFELQATDLFGYVRKGAADQTDVADALQAMAEESGLVDHYGQDHIQAIMAAAVEGESEDEEATDHPASRAKTSDWRHQIVSAKDLCTRSFKKLHYVVPGLFTEGVTLLASRPKLGKSWLLLQITTAVATGTITLAPPPDGESPPKGRTLYLALEDNERRLQRRMTKFYGSQRERWPADWEVVTKWRRFDQGGLDDLREWCRSGPNPTVIAVDTLKRVRPPKRMGQTDYDADYEACQGLLDLAAEFPGLAILVATHDRKMDAEDPFDTVSGTLGLTGGVDAIAVMKRKAGAVTLYIEGRDLEDQVEKAISFDKETCRWSILGNAAEVQRSGERHRVLAALAAAPDGMSVTEITAAASMVSRGATDKLLFNMVRDGEVARVKRGVYALPGISLSKNTSKNGKKVRSELSTLKNQEDKSSSPDLTVLTACPQHTSEKSEATPRVGATALMAEPDDGLSIPEFLRRAPKREPAPPIGINLAATKAGEGEALR
jgi:hypothetical protein